MAKKKAQPKKVARKVQPKKITRKAQPKKVARKAVSFNANSKISNLTIRELTSLIDSRISPGGMASHVNSGPTSWKEGGGHYDWAGLNVKAPGRLTQPGGMASHVNSGPTSWKEGGGHADFTDVADIGGLTILGPDGRRIHIDPNKGPKEVKFGKKFKLVRL